MRKWRLRIYAAFFVLSKKHWELHRNSSEIESCSPLVATNLCCSRPRLSHRWCLLMSSLPFSATSCRSDSQSRRCAPMMEQQDLHAAPRNGFLSLGKMDLRPFPTDLWRAALRQSFTAFLSSHFPTGGGSSSGRDIGWFYPSATTSTMEHYRNKDWLEYDCIKIVLWYPNSEIIEE